MNDERKDNLESGGSAAVLSPVFEVRSRRETESKSPGQHQGDSFVQQQSADPSMAKMIFSVYDERGPRWFSALWVMFWIVSSWSALWLTMPVMPDLPACKVLPVSCWLRHHVCSRFGEFGIQGKKQDRILCAENRQRSRIQDEQLAPADLLQYACQDFVPKRDLGDTCQQMFATHSRRHS